MLDKILLGGSHETCAKTGNYFLSLALAACGSSSDEPKVYSNLQECAADTGNAEQCEKWMAEAAKETPRFESREECEAKFGQGACNQTQSGSSGHSFFMPMMLGFLAGNMLSNQSMPASGLYGNPAQPEAARDAKGAPARSGRLGNALSRSSRTNGGVTRGGFSGGGRAGS